MTISLVCLLMCAGLMLPAFLLQKSPSAQKGTPARLWPYLGISPILPALACTTGSLRWIAISALCYYLLTTWWWFTFDVTFRRLLHSTKHRLSHGSFTGLCSSLLYPIVIGFLAFPDAAGPTQAAWISPFYFTAAIAWIIASYSAVLKARTTILAGREGEDRRSTVDRAFGLLYASYIGQGTAALIGLSSMLFGPQEPLEPNLVSAWPAFLCYTFAACFTCAVAAIPTWRRPLISISALLALAGSIALWTVMPQTTGGAAFPVAFMAALGLADSILWNGYRLHGRPLTAFPSILIALLWMASTVGLSWILNASVTSASKLTRDGFAALSSLLLIGWFYHIATAWVIVGDGTVFSEEKSWIVRTQNGPRFNLLHDSLFIAPCMALGVTPLIWQSLGRPGGIEALMSLLAATLVGVGIVIKFGVLNGFAHMKESPTSQQLPRDLGVRMIAQWGILGLILAAGWVGPFLIEASRFLSMAFQ